MLKVRFLLLCILLTCGAPCAHAGQEAESDPQEPAATSGTITVEVVYKDTGEPVEGVVVKIMPRRARVRYDWDDRKILPPSGRFVSAGVPFGAYDVTIRNPGWWFYYSHGITPSRFLYAKSETSKQVHLVKETPTAEILFEVQRGWKLSGVVRRADGSPLGGGLVMVEQGEDESDSAYALTQGDGRFDMLGVAAKREGARPRLLENETCWGNCRIRPFVLQGDRARW